MTFEKCPKCGQGGLYDFDPIDITTPSPSLNIDLFPTSNYCSKCGDSLWETCFSCNGTGHNYSAPLVDIGPKYCSDCGRKLKSKKVDTKCSSCNGKGKIKKSHFCS